MRTVGRRTTSGGSRCRRPPAGNFVDYFDAAMWSAALTRSSTFAPSVVDPAPICGIANSLYVVDGGRRGEADGLSRFEITLAPVALAAERNRPCSSRRSMGSRGHSRRRILLGLLTSPRRTSSSQRFRGRGDAHDQGVEPVRVDGRDRGGGTGTTTAFFNEPTASSRSSPDRCSCRMTTWEPGHIRGGAPHPTTSELHQHDGCSATTPKTSPTTPPATCSSSMASVRYGQRGPMRVRGAAMY